MSEVLRSDNPVGGIMEHGLVLVVSSIRGPKGSTVTVERMDE